MATSGVFSKDASAVLDYKFDWAALTNASAGGTSDWLQAGETISTDTDGVSVSITPSGDTGDLAVDSYSLTDSNTSVTVWLSGGVVGSIYYVTCSITTTSGRTDERTIEVDITGLTNCYATLQEMKSPDILKLSDNTHDSVIEREIAAASRKIDEFCGRYFYQVGSEARYFTPERADFLKIDDLYSSTGLTIEIDGDNDRTFELTWSSSDYDLWPYNPRNSRPYVAVVPTYVNGYAFHVYRKSVKITSAYWGWSAVPDAVNQACVMIANRLHKRNQTILGQAGASAIGNITLKIPALDPDVQELLLPFRKSLT